MNRTCLHEMVWWAIESGLADSRLGDWDEGGRRKPKLLAGPYEETLTDVRTEDLYLNRLAHPLIGFVWGERDPFGGPEIGRRLVELLPKARLEVVSNGGHLTWIDDVDRAVSIVEQHLSHPVA